MRGIDVGNRRCLGVSLFESALKSPTKVLRVASDEFAGNNKHALVEMVLVKGGSVHGDGDHVWVVQLVLGEAWRWVADAAERLRVCHVVVAVAACGWFGVCGQRLVQKRCFLNSSLGKIW